MSTEHRGQQIEMMVRFKTPEENDIISQRAVGEDILELIERRIGRAIQGVILEQPNMAEYLSYVLITCNLSFGVQVNKPDGGHGQ